MLYPPAAVPHLDYHVIAEVRKGELEELRRRNLTKPMVSHLNKARAPKAIIDFARHQQQLLEDERRQRMEAKDFLRRYRAAKESVLRKTARLRAKSEKVRRSDFLIDTTRCPTELYDEKLDKLRLTKQPASNTISETTTKSGITTLNCDITRKTETKASASMLQFSSSSDRTYICSSTIENEAINLLYHLGSTGTVISLYILWLFSNSVGFLGAISFALPILGIHVWLESSHFQDIGSGTQCNLSSIIANTSLLTIKRLQLQSSEIYCDERKRYLEKVTSMIRESSEKILPFICHAIVATGSKIQDTLPPENMCRKSMLVKSLRMQRAKAKQLLTEFTQVGESFQTEKEVAVYRKMQNALKDAIFRHSKIRMRVSRTKGIFSNPVDFPTVHFPTALAAVQDSERDGVAECASLVRGSFQLKLELLKRAFDTAGPTRRGQGLLCCFTRDTNDQFLVPGRSTRLPFLIEDDRGSQETSSPCKAGTRTYSDIEEEEQSSRRTVSCAEIASMEAQSKFENSPSSLVADTSWQYVKGMDASISSCNDSPEANKTKEKDQKTKKSQDSGTDKSLTITRNACGHEPIPDVFAQRTKFQTVISFGIGAAVGLATILYRKRR